MKNKRVDYSSVKIDKGIPVPASIRKGAVKHLIASMKVGDSIFFHNRGNAQYIGSCISAAGGRGVVRGEYSESGALKGYRVWKGAA